MHFPPARVLPILLWIILGGQCSAASGEEGGREGGQTLAVYSVSLASTELQNVTEKHNQLSN